MSIYCERRDSGIVKVQQKSTFRHAEMNVYLLNYLSVCFTVRKYITV